MKTLNKLVAVSPFPTKSVTTVKKGGLVIAESKVSLTKLEVMLESEDSKFRPGMVVYVNGNLSTNPEWSNLHKLEQYGLEFILIPESVIQLVE